MNSKHAQSRVDHISSPGDTHRTPSLIGVHQQNAPPGTEFLPLNTEIHVNLEVEVELPFAQWGEFWNKFQDITTEVVALVDELHDADPSRTRTQISEGLRVAGSAPLARLSGFGAQPVATTKAARRVIFRYAPVLQIELDKVEDVLYSVVAYVRNRMSHCARVREQPDAYVVVEIDLSNIRIVAPQAAVSPSASVEIDVTFENDPTETAGGS